MDVNVIKLKKIFSLSKKELEFLYFDLNLSQTDIAKLLGTDASNVSRKFKKENVIPNKKNMYISIKQLQNKIEITKDFLMKEYPNKSITEIAKKCGVSYSYIYKKMKEYDIPIKNNGFFQRKYIDNMTRDILFDLYWNKEMSLSEIGLFFNTDKNYIKRRFKEFNIKIRTKKEAFNLKKHKIRKKEILKSLIGDKLTNFSPVYNKNSISIIENFGKKNGFKFQHAENGGEFFIDKLFYWVDGYDKEKNVVVEYYEKQHKYKKEYDKNRLKKIKDYLKCDIYIIHENNIIEKY